MNDFAAVRFSEVERAGAFCERPRVRSGRFAPSNQRNCRASGRATLNNGVNTRKATLRPLVISRRKEPLSVLSAWALSSSFFFLFFRAAWRGLGRAFSRYCYGNRGVITCETRGDPLNLNNVYIKYPREYEMIVARGERNKIYVAQSIAIARVYWVSAMEKVSSVFWTF